MKNKKVAPKQLTINPENGFADGASNQQLTINYMLSQLPINLEKVKKEDLDKEILRLGMIAELDAVSLYEQLADMTGNEDIKKILLDIAKEEKTHTGEFQALLLKIDKEQAEEFGKGEKEVEKLTK